MIILAIDTSGSSLSAALLEDEMTRAEIFVDTGGNHSVHLLPAIKHIYDLAKVTPRETDLFVCTQGPGSFTGLRVGVGTIKGLAMATGKPLLGLSTLEALTANIDPLSARVRPLVDAQRGQVYAAVFRASWPLPVRIAEERIVDADLLIAELAGEESTIFLGSGAMKYSDRIKETLPGCGVAASLSSVKASVVGRLGFVKYCRGARDDVLTFAPRYLRLSEAERKASGSST